MPKRQRSYSFGDLGKPKPPLEVIQWNDPVTMETVFTTRHPDGDWTVRLQRDVLANQMMAQWNNDLAARMVYNQLAAPAASALTAEMILATMREAQAQMGIAMGGAGPIGAPPPMPVNLGAMRDLLMPGLEAMAFQRYAHGWFNPRGVWGGEPSFPRIDAETAATSRERARGLLKSLLTPAQWAEFELGGAVTERIGGCEFTLRPGGMIQAKKPRLVGSVNEAWCVYPDPYADKNDFMPEEDKLIGQLLHLRAGPDQVRRMANVFPG